MGRFDALTQIEEKPQRPAPSPVTSSPAVNTLQGQPIKKQVEAEKKPAYPQARKPAKPSPTLDGLEKPEKYTTRLLPSWVKKIRLDAIEKDIKDYEVVTAALKLYFESKK
jgi:hypothetical protein